MKKGDFCYKIKKCSYNSYNSSILYLHTELKFETEKIITKWKLCHWTVTHNYHYFCNTILKLLLKHVAYHYIFTKLLRVFELIILYFCERSSQADIEKPII